MLSEKCEHRSDGCACAGCRRELDPHTGLLHLEALYLLDKPRDHFRELCYLIAVGFVLDAIGYLSNELSVRLAIDSIEASEC